MAEAVAVDGAVGFSITHESKHAWTKLNTSQTRPIVASSVRVCYTASFFSAAASAPSARGT